MQQKLGHNCKKWNSTDSKSKILALAKEVTEVCFEKSNELDKN